MSKVFSIIFLSFFCLFMISCDSFITTAYVPAEEATTAASIVTTASPYTDGDEYSAYIYWE